MAPLRVRNLLSTNAHTRAHATHMIWHTRFASHFMSQTFESIRTNHRSMAAKHGLVTIPANRSRARTQMQFDRSVLPSTHHACVAQFSAWTTTRQSRCGRHTTPVKEELQKQRVAKEDTRSKLRLRAGLRIHSVQHYAAWPVFHRFLSDKSAVALQANTPAHNDTCPATVPVKRLKNFCNHMRFLEPLKSRLHPFLRQPPVNDRVHLTIMEADIHCLVERRAAAKHEENARVVSQIRLELGHTRSALFRSTELPSMEAELIDQEGQVGVCVFTMFY